jgi:hypothetical protein
MEYVPYLRALMILVIGLSLIFKPTWYLKSQGEIFEKKKKTLKLIGVLIVICSLGDACLASIR